MNTIQQQFTNLDCKLILENNYGQFYTTTLRGYETIILIKDSKIFINYSNVVNKIKESKDAFSNLIKTEYFFNHFKYYCMENNIEFKNKDNFNSIEELLNNSKNIFIKVSGLGSVQGTYGPTDFIDTILITIDPSYAKEVHSLLNQVQLYSNLTNISFKKGLDLEIMSLKRKNEKLIKKVNKLETRLQLQEQTLEELDDDINNIENLRNELEELREENKQLEDENTELKNKYMSKKLNEFKKSYKEPVINDLNSIKDELKRTSANYQLTLEVNKTLRIKIYELDSKLKYYESQMLDLSYFLNKWDLMEKMNREVFKTLYKPTLAEQIRNVYPYYRFKQNIDQKDQLIDILSNPRYTAYKFRLIGRAMSDINKDLEGELNSEDYSEE